MQHVAQLAHPCGDRAVFESRLVDEHSCLVEELEGRSFRSALLEDVFAHVEAFGHVLRTGELKGSVGQAFENRSTNRLLVNVGGTVRVCHAVVFAATTLYARVSKLSIHALPPQDESFEVVSICGIVGQPVDGDAVDLCLANLSSHGGESWKNEHGKSV